MAAQIGRYAHAKQFRRMHRELKKLKGRLGRVVRDLEHKTASWDVVPEALTRELALAQRVFSTSNGPVPTSCTACMHPRWREGCRRSVRWSN